MNAPNNKGGGLSWSQPPVRKSDEQKDSAAYVKAPDTKRPSLLPAASVSPNNNVPTRMPVVVASLVVGVIVGVLFGWAWFVNPQQQENGEVASQGLVPTGREEEVETPLAPPAAIAGGSAGSNIGVAAQPAGSQVAISSVSVGEPTWVVVYESRGGLPGNALGAKLFTTTEKSGSVYLLRNTAAGHTYFVGTRTDNGNRVFSLESDTPVVDASGKMIVSQFVAK